MNMKMTFVAGVMCLLAPLVSAAENKTETAAPALTAASLFPDEVIAKGKGVEVKQSQVDEAYLAYKANRVATGQQVPPDELRPKVEADILDKLIATQLFLKLASEADKTKAKEIEAQVITEQLRQAPSAESFNRQVRALGMTPEQFRSQVAEQAIVQTVIDRLIKAKKTVSDADAKNFYEKNPNLFHEPETVHVSHILFSTRDLATGRDLPDDQKLEKKRLAEKVLAQAKTGADFAGLVKQHSEDRASKDKGGEYTIVRRQQSEVLEFEAAAFSLAPNRISDIVTTRFGYHIIKGGEKTPAKKTEYAKVEAKIKETLLQEEVKKDLPAFIDRLKKDAGVEILAAGKKK